MMKNMSKVVLLLSALIAQTSACDAGSAPSVPDGGDCKFCPAGTYALSGDLYCTHCPPGFWAPINSVSKDACYPLSAFKVAEVCDAGSAPKNNVCTFCPVGTYALAGQQSCTSCPVGQSSPPNSVSPDACFVKSSKKVKGLTCAAGSIVVDGVCTFCPPGQYALAGAETCSHCAPGFWAPINSVSASACYPLSAFKVAEVCDAGSTPVNDVCTFCPVGSYALAAAQSCTKCPPGFSAPIASVSPDACYPVGAKKVKGLTTCAAGSTPVNGVCAFCPVGSYALAAAQSCTVCPIGFSAPIASVSPDACYPTSSKKVKSSSCDAGSMPVSQPDGSKLCTFCPIGSYALAAADSCTKCPVGYSSPINSVSKDACVSQLRAGAKSNKKVREAVCAAGSHPIAGVCTSCPIGTYALAAAQSCTQCPGGFTAPIASVSPDACYPFGPPAGAVIPSVKAVKEVLSCAAGSAPVDGVCTFCPIGTYALAAQASCTTCPPNYSSPINSVSKTACYPVSSVGKAVKDALLCPPGSAPEGGVCTFCPVGAYALAGASACTKCPVGFSAPPNSVSPDACFPVGFPAAKKVKDLVTCAAGSTPVFGACTSCPVGSYALAAAQSCTKCPLGFSAPIASVSADACYPLSSKSVKEACPAGSAPKGGECTFCPLGTYALAGAGSCTRCPPGQSAPINSVSKDACAPVAKNLRQ